MEEGMYNARQYTKTGEGIKLERWFTTGGSNRGFEIF